MNTLSKKGERTRARILAYLKQNVQPISPVTYQEIADSLDIASTNTIKHHLKILQERGLIELTAAGRIKVHNWAYKHNEASHE